MTEATQATPPTDDPKPETTAKKSKTEPPKDKFVAIIFDPTLKRQSSFLPGLLAKILRVNARPAAVSSTLQIARMPIQNKNGVYESAGEPVMLRAGSNLGVSIADWEFVSRHKDAAISEYRNSGCFKEFYPTETGSEGRTYADYDEEDAIELVTATLALPLLDQWIVGEDRKRVKNTYDAIYSSIAADLAARQPAAY
jgi:hypothetical protein